MASEINEVGYETIRTLVNSSLTTAGSWDYIELLDTNDNIVTRVSITTDSRASWTTASDTSQTQTVEITVTGADADITTPVTLQESILKNTDSDTADELHRDTMTNAPIEQSSDEVTVQHNIEIPQV